MQSEIAQESHKISCGITKCYINKLYRPYGILIYVMLINHINIMVINRTNENRAR